MREIWVRLPGPRASHGLVYVSAHRRADEVSWDGTQIGRALFWAGLLGHINGGADCRSWSVDAVALASPVHNFFFKGR